jgi:regulator of sigma E protease
MNIIVAILILGVIIIIHELGHFLLAKKNGITVTEFSIGMGPRIASFVRNGTRYSLKVLPFGGSCMMLGEDETIEDEGAFQKKSVWARFSVIFAGAFFNFILAFVLALIVLGAEGVDLPKIADMEKGSPIAQAGLKAGDKITNINGSTIHFDREIYAYLYFNPLSEKEIKITYERNGEKNTVSVAPQLINTYHLGCTFNSQKENAEISEITPDYHWSRLEL